MNRESGPEHALARPTRDDTIPPSRDGADVAGCEVRLVTRGLPIIETSGMEAERG
jgi:hypothetical protein